MSTIPHTRAHGRKLPRGLACIVVLACLAANAAGLKRALSSTTAYSVRFLDRYDHLKDYLPSRGRISYTPDPRLADAVRRLDPTTLTRVSLEVVMSQLALAPLLCDMHTLHEYVIGAFKEGPMDPQMRVMPGYVLLAESKEGICLFRRDHR